MCALIRMQATCLFSALTGMCTTLLTFNVSILKATDNAVDERPRQNSETWLQDEMG